MSDDRWSVRIRYREPSYELRSGTVRLYSGTFLVSTPTPELAEAHALRQFREWERLSDVGWPREVFEVVVERVEGGAA